MTRSESDRALGPSKLRRLFSIAVGLVVLAALIVTVVENWTDFLNSWRRIGVEGAAAALVLGAVNMVATWLQWRTLLEGLDIHWDVRTSGRVFFLSQIGKYAPGAVWPIMLQLQASRRRGGSRKAVMAGYVMAIAVSLTSGLVLAGILLPFSMPAALSRFWWALAVVPLLAIVVHPSTLPRVLDLCLRKLGRQPLGIKLPARAILHAILWSLLAWAAIGAQTTVLASAAGAGDPGLFALCTGGTALAICAGILFLPAPAGAGSREIVLAYVLATVLSGSSGLAVVVASRVTSIAVDLLMAAVGLCLRRPRARQGEVTNRTIQPGG